ncbi:response regulator [bacterium]|nr:response regulator [bacterium]
MRIGLAIVVFLLLEYGVFLMNTSPILIVDDDPQVHKMLGAVLTPKQYSILSAGDAQEAWGILKTKAPRLVLLDIMMPGMSGIELCKMIREDQDLKDTLVLMISAKDSQTDRLAGLQYGADDYVTKPFHVSTLVNKIEHMLSKVA